MLLRSTLLVIVFAFLFMAELSACKIWATMLKSGNSFSSLAQEEQELIQFQMRAYYDQSQYNACLLYTSPSPRDRSISRMPSSA